MPAGPAPTGANAPGGCLGPARGAVAAHSAALAEDPTASGVASLASLVLPANKARTSGRRGRKGHDRAAHARKLLSFIIGKGPAEGIRCGCERRPHAPSWPLRRNGRRPGDWGPGPECGLRVRHGEGRGRPDGPGVGSADHGGGGVTVQAAGHVLPAAGPCMRLQRQGGGC